MFRHKGKTRTLVHNLKIASLLSFVAGLVNVVGFFSIQRLTTNVTGHFAFLIDEVFKLNAAQAFIFFLYILFFFLGSFVSNFMVEAVSRKSERLIFIYPVIFESLVLSALPLAGQNWILANPNFTACLLLFAMGLQNSLVTSISNAMVRTTHLTGLFTDLGIELSQLFFYKSTEEKSRLLASVRLRLTIISFFFLGGLLGAVFYSYFQINTLLLAAGLLATGLIYDNIRFKVIQLKRRLIKVNNDE